RVALDQRDLGIAGHAVGGGAKRLRLAIQGEDPDGAPGTTCPPNERARDVTASGAHVEQRQAAVPRKVRDETLHVTQGQPCSAEEGIEARDVLQVLREGQEGCRPVEYPD